MEGDIIVTGRVKEVSSSRRTITFDEPVHGFTGIDLRENTQIVSSEGAPRTLQDIQPGMVVQASGGAGGTGTVVATRVRLVSGPSPTNP